MAQSPSNESTPSERPPLTAADDMHSEPEVYLFWSAKPSIEPLDLVELSVCPPRPSECKSEFPLWLDLRFGNENIITENWRIALHLARAELIAYFKGCGIAPGSRFGDDPLPPIEVTTERELDETDVSGSAEASAKLGGGLVEGVSASASMKIAGTAQARSKTARERSGEIIQRRVAALPNDRWEINEPRGWLGKTYLRAPAADNLKAEPLCRVVADAESLTVTLSIEVHPQDVVANITPRDHKGMFSWWPKSRPDKSAIVKILLVRAAAERFSREDEERVTLARAILRGKRNIGGGGQ